eukprot:scaffold7714_cov390-Prasinococcus_capsulatus_cf.AAC.12
MSLGLVHVGNLGLRRWLRHLLVRRLSVPNGVCSGPLRDARGGRVDCGTLWRRTKRAGLNLPLGRGGRVRHGGTSWGAPPTTAVLQLWKLWGDTSLGSLRLGRNWSSQERRECLGRFDSSMDVLRPHRSAHVAASARTATSAAREESGPSTPIPRVGRAYSRRPEPATAAHCRPATCRPRPAVAYLGRRAASDPQKGEFGAAVAHKRALEALAGPMRERPQDNAIPRAQCRYYCRRTFRH